MKRILLLGSILISSLPVMSQVGIGTVSPHSSAILDISSTSKGFLPPRVSSHAVIASPAAGLVIYDESDNCLNVFNNSTWIDLCTSPGSGNSSSASFARGWETDLRFDQYNITDADIGYGITTNKNLYMWGYDQYDYIRQFNQSVLVDAEDKIIGSPYFIDFPFFNGKVKDFVTEDYTHYVLTTDNTVWVWGSREYNRDGLTPSATGYNKSNGRYLPVLFPVPNGNTGIKEIERARMKLIFLTTEGNVYVRGQDLMTPGFEGYTYEIAKPNGVPGDFKYTTILGTAGYNSEGVYLMGSNGKYYCAVFQLHARYFITGNVSALPNHPDPHGPSVYSIKDIRLSSSIYELTFPSGHGSMVKIHTDRSNIIHALDDIGNLYAWGEHEAVGIGGTKQFETDASNLVNRSMYKSCEYFTTPVLVKLPSGETTCRDFVTPFSGNVTLILGGSGQLYTIGEPQNNLMYGITLEDSRKKYQSFIQTTGDYVQIESASNSILLRDKNNELLGLGQNKRGILGLLPEEFRLNVDFDRISPTPILKGSLDVNNNNVQPVN